MSVTGIDELRAAREAEGLDPDEGGAGLSVAERAENGDGEPTQEELFPLGTVDGDPKKTLKTLLRAGVPIKYTCALSSAKVPMRGGLIDFESSGDLLVTFESGKLEVVPKIEKDEGGKRRVVEAELRQKLRVSYVQPADGMYTREQVLDILHRVGVPESADIISELLGSAS